MCKNFIIPNNKKLSEINKVMSKQWEVHFRRFLLAKNETIWTLKRLIIIMNWNLSTMFQSMNSLWYFKIKLIGPLWKMIGKATHYLENW